MSHHLKSLVSGPLQKWLSSPGTLHAPCSAAAGEGEGSKQFNYNLQISRREIHVGADGRRLTTQGQQSLWKGRSLQLTFKGDQQRGPETGICLGLSTHENM